MTVHNCLLKCFEVHPVHLSESYEHLYCKRLIECKSTYFPIGQNSFVGTRKVFLFPKGQYPEYGVVSKKNHAFENLENIFSGD